jgi:hypothetical protein
MRWILGTDLHVVRDNWEGRKAGLEEELTTLFGQPWTIEVNPNQIYAYAEEGYAKESPGSMISQYVEMPNPVVEPHPLTS